MNKLIINSGGVGSIDGLDRWELPSDDKDNKSRKPSTKSPSQNKRDIPAQRPEAVPTRGGRDR